MDPKLKTYVLTIRYRENHTDDWEFKNVIVESVDVKSAIKKARDQFVLAVRSQWIVDNIYSEESLV